jgi:hypothetical protein
MLEMKQPSALAESMVFLSMKRKLPEEGMKQFARDFLKAAYSHPEMIHS